MITEILSAEILAKYNISLYNNNKEMVRAIDLLQTLTSLPTYQVIELINDLQIADAFHNQKEREKLF